MVSLYRASRLAHRITRDDPLDAAQSRVLVAVKRLGPARPSAIAADIHIDLSTASRQIDGLVRKGLAAKSSDPEDARATLVTVTPAGRRTLTTLLTNRARAIEPAMAGWSASDRRTLERLLTRLADDLETHLSGEDTHS